MLARPVDRIPSSEINADLFLQKYRARKPFIIYDIPSLQVSLRHVIDGLLSALCRSCDTVEVMKAHDNSNFLDDQSHVDKVNISSRDLIKDLAVSHRESLYYYRQPVTIPEQLLIVDSLLNDIIKPLLGTEDRRLGEPVLWLGTAGNITPCHYDSAHVFMIQLKGTKRWTMFPSQDSRLMYSYDSTRKLPSKDLVSDHYLTRHRRDGLPYHASRLRNLNQIWNPVGSSKTNLDTKHIEALDYLFKDELDEGPFIATLNEGEVLFNPAGFWHEVVSDTSCISITVPVPLTKHDVENSHVPINLLF